jgi:hypothetical protein
MRTLAGIALLLLPALAHAEGLDLYVDAPLRISCGVPFTILVHATGGVEPIAWSADILPPGVSAVPEGRVLAVSGKVSTDGYTITFGVTARDATGDELFVTWIVLVDHFRSFTILTRTLPSVRQGEPYASRIEATDSAVEFTLISGEPPEGILLSPDGLLSGTTLDEPGVHPFAIEARSEGACDPVRSSYGIRVLPGNPARLAPTSRDPSAPAGGCGHGGDASMAAFAVAWRRRRDVPVG